MLVNAKYFNKVTSIPVHLRLQNHQTLQEKGSPPIVGGVRREWGNFLSPIFLIYCVHSNLGNFGFTKNIE
jgi:hypothetical protein